MGVRLDRIGEIRRNKESLGGYEMKIVEYNRNDDIIIEFQDKNKVKVKTKYEHFKRGDKYDNKHDNIFIDIICFIQKIL